MMGNAPLHASVSAARGGLRWGRVLCNYIVAMVMTMIVSVYFVEFTGLSDFSPISSAFAKKKGKNAARAANRKAERKNAKIGRGNKRDDVEAEVEEGIDEGPEAASEVIDFHDEGFSSGRRMRIKLPRKLEPDFLDRGHKANLDENIAFGDMFDLKKLKQNLHEGLSVNDQVSVKSLNKELGDIDAYVKPFEKSAPESRGHEVAGESRAHQRGAVASRGGDKDQDIHDLKTGETTKDLNPDDRLDPNSLDKTLDIKEAVKLLDSSSAPYARRSEPQEAAREKNSVVEADSTEKQNTAKDQTLTNKQQLRPLRQEKNELKSQIAELKEERANAETKEERKATTAEIKDLKQELRELKQAIKTLKGEPQGAVAAEQDASNGVDIEPIQAGTYASSEVLALDLSVRAHERVRALGFQVSDSSIEYGGVTLRTLFIPERMDALEALRVLRKELPSESFHLNRLYRPYNTATKDNVDNSSPGGQGANGRCRGDKCYGKAAIGWKDRFTNCARNINVGVIDTDVDLKHPAFSGQKIARRTFLADGKQSSPDAHGTGVLALLAGRPESDTPGLIPEAQFFVANVFFTDANGDIIADTVSLLKSLEWMNSSQARIVNMSFSGPRDDLVQARFKAMRARGFVFTAAAGNEGPAALPAYPAAYPEVIAVTAVAKDKRAYSSANRGPYIDIAAPGVAIWTAMPEGREGYQTGTSFATPFATAVLALQQPGLMHVSKDELLDHLNIVKLGNRTRDPIYGRGLLQAPGECSTGTKPAPDPAPQTSSIAQ